MSEVNVRASRPDARRRASLALALIAAIAVAAAAAIFSSGEASAGETPSSCGRSGRCVIWKINGTNIWKFPIKYESEAREASRRFNAIYNRGFRISDLRVVKSGRAYSLRAGGSEIFAASPAFARASRLAPMDISLMMLSRVYGALGKSARLTRATRIRGKYEVLGSVSWYGGSHMGRKFANGEKFTPTHLTAAAKSLPFGTLVRVTRRSGKSVVVRITDRFMEHKGRLLDLSQAAAGVLGIKGLGVAKARIEVLGSVDRIGGRR